MNKPEAYVYSLRRPLLFIVVLLGLSACASTSSWPSIITERQDSPPENRTEPAPESEEETPSTRSSREQRRDSGPGADFYLDAASQAEGKERNALLLSAAESLHAEGDDEQALEIVQDLPINELPSTQRRRAILLMAELGQFADRPLTLLSELPPPKRETPEDVAYRIWGARANAHLALGQTLDAVHALVRQEQYIQRRAALREHHEHIWRTLRSAPPLDTNPQELATYDKVTRGWVELADVMLDLWLGPEELRSAIGRWERRYPQHAGNRTVLSQQTAKPARGPTPRPSPRQSFQTDDTFDTIALLLPLSGPYEAPAAAIRDGFMTAYYRRPEPRPRILVFDTGRPDDSIEHIAEQALVAGADIVVGPLEKDKVSRLAESFQSPVPLLALNYLEKGTSSGPNDFYQFGLSPEDEASQVAERALADGRLNALAIVPDTDWGRRTLQAFQDTLHAKGGQLLDYEFFDPNQADFRQPITRLLGYSSGGIRQDMDYIFLAARPQHARLIRPQLRFFRASRVPVYATSHVYTGQLNPRKDQDLDGIRFGDMPWILDKGEDLKDARDTAANLWPSSYAQLPRLYALGFDAYALANQIGKNNLKQGFGYPAASGVLTLEAGGRISRGLVWAHFSNGRPRLLADKPPSEEILEEERAAEEGYLPDELKP